MAIKHSKPQGILRLRKKLNFLRSNNNNDALICYTSSKTLKYICFLFGFCFAIAFRLRYIKNISSHYGRLNLHTFCLISLFGFCFRVNRMLESIFSNSNCGSQQIKFRKEQINSEFIVTRSENIYEVERGRGLKQTMNEEYAQEQLLIRVVARQNVLKLNSIVVLVI